MRLQQQRRLQRRLRRLSAWLPLRRAGTEAPSALTLPAYAARIERKGPLPLLSSGKKRYLFIIHELGQNGNAVHSKDIASSLSVKQPSVSKMLNALAEDGLIEKEYYGAATFTPEGARLSNKLYTDYLLLFSLFRKQLGLSESDARHDAIVCLCDLSDAGVQRMASAVLDCEPCKQTQI